MTTTSRRTGFTLVELIVVIGIILVLAAIMFPTALLVMSASRKELARSEIAGMAVALEQYRRGGRRALPPDRGSSNAMTLHEDFLTLTSEPVVEAFADGRRYDFDPKRLDENDRYLDPFGESYRYDVIQGGEKFILMSFGPNREFDGVGSAYNRRSDDIFNSEFDPANPDR